MPSPLPSGSMKLYLPLQQSITSACNPCISRMKAVHAVACDGAVRALRQVGLAHSTMDAYKQDRAGTLTVAVLEAIQQPCMQGP